MATIFFGFTIQGGNGTQTVQLIKTSDNSIVSSTTANAANGSPYSASWEDTDLDCENIGSVKIRVISGAAQAESSNFSMNCPCICTTWSVQGNEGGGNFQYINCLNAPIMSSVSASETTTRCVKVGTTPNMSGDVTGVDTSGACTS